MQQYVRKLVTLDEGVCKIITNLKNAGCTCKRGDARRREEIKKIS